MNKRCLDILEHSKNYGWVLEPESKEIMKLCGLTTTRYAWLRGIDEADSLQFRFPVIAKIVSPAIMHKSETGGIITGITTVEGIKKAYSALAGLEGFSGIIVEEMVSGAEVIMGAKMDPQFGRVVMIGIGGTSVEIYRDAAIRIAPTAESESLAAIESLKGLNLLTGYRGRPAVDLMALSRFLSKFSRVFAGLGDGIESIDLNPVMCSGNRIIIADARIILSRP